MTTTEQLTDAVKQTDAAYYSHNKLRLAAMTARDDAKLAAHKAAAADVLVTHAAKFLDGCYAFEETVRLLVVAEHTEANGFPLPA